MNTLAPRGAAKSTWLSQAYVLYCAVHRLESFIVLTSDTAIQAEKYLEAIRDELTDNELLRRDYPTVTGKTKVWRTDAIVLKNGVRIEALGTGAKVRGRKHHQYRPTLIVVDDPQNAEHIISKLKRERTWRWLTNDVCNAGSPETNIVAAGTALHPDCIVCRLIETPGWRSLKFQAIESWPDRMDLWDEWEEIIRRYDDPDRDAKARSFYESNRIEMDRGARVLWPDREPLYALMVLRASIGDSAFNYEKQNDPLDPEQCEWPPVCFTHAALYFDEWPKGLQVKTLFLDPSKGKTDKQGDYSAFIRYGRTIDGTEFVEADLKRRSPDQIVADGIEHLKQFKPDGFGVEANTFQELFAPLFRSAADKHQVPLPLYLLTNTTNKNVRIRRLTEPITQRRLRFKRGSPGTMLLLQQLREFPNSAHDDGPDALEGARRLAYTMCNTGKVR